VALGEVAGGVIGDKLYLVGEGNPATLVYDIPTDTWSIAAARPLPGNHHAAETIGDKLYLFGGLTADSEGEVQIYDPAANQWSQGADMPFAAGSSSSAVIGGMVYVAGGITASGTTSRAARYDPATNSWTELAAMPHGRNHTASGTDGSRLWVFGGRGPGSGDFNVTTNGFDDVQVYDPATNSWASSDDAGSGLAPLPQARGGMGKAVFLGGEFYVIGGETLTGAGATPDKVYHRVDVYDPATNTWRLDAPMPTARHGIFPLAHGGKIYVAVGGVHFGGSQSKVIEVFTPEPAPVPPGPPPAAAAAVVGRWVFYNNSTFDGNDPTANAADDLAVAPDKSALLPGQAPATFANYTSYDRGINGVMVDIAGLPAGAEATLSTSDFAFASGNDDAPAAWRAAPAATSITVRRGSGAGGSDRVTLVWPDGQIRKQWLRVTVMPTPNTGLAAPDVFYFGNAFGETGNRSGDARVNAADARLTRRNRTRPRLGILDLAPRTSIDSRFDFDRNGVVDVLDRRIARHNRTRKSEALVLITP
jgi:N-acetylneuraminic acid mutarotase